MAALHQEELLEDWPHQCASPDKAGNAVRRETLLEHWPKRKSSSTFDSYDTEKYDETSVAIKRDRRHIRTVQFSESSQLLFYEREPKYVLRSLSYTKDDRTRFGREALIDGVRIKKLIEAAPTDSTAESIRYLLHHKIINRAELIGMEHFYLDTPMNVLKRRRRHAAAVLRRQQEQQQQQNIDDPDLSLSEFAQSSSLRSAKRARIRAAMAA